MPSKIDWCDKTVNPQGWGCWGPGGTPQAPKRCWYCYSEGFAHRELTDCLLCRQFVPHWHPERLEEVREARWRVGTRIFWGSMSDIMHPCTPAWQIRAILEVVKATPWWMHIFCTKYSARYQEFNPWPFNCILLTTITGHPSLWKEEQDRKIHLLKTDCRVRGLSIEPLLGPAEVSAYLYPYCIIVDNWALGTKMHWLIIGAMTGRGASRFRPAPAWVQGLIDQGRAAGVPVFLKGNLHWPEKIQEFPK